MGKEGLLITIRALPLQRSYAHINFRICVKFTYLYLLHFYLYPIRRKSFY
jgi:hypothetical protein